MKHSQFSILLANLFLLTSLISREPGIILGCLFFSFLWLISSAYGMALERKQEFREERLKLLTLDLIIDFIKTYKNGNTTTKRR